MGIYGSIMHSLQAKLGTTDINNYDLAANSTYETDAKTNWQFGWGARTGGQNDRHQLDDILVVGKSGLLYSYDGGTTFETNATKTISGSQAVIVVVKADGTCNTSTTNLFSINNITPVFSPIANICSGSTLTPLPTTSNNGVVGSWLPALNNLATTIYTFTPNAGQCAATTTLTITVKPNYTITASAGINGSISPSGNSSVCEGSNITYTITPNANYQIANVLVDGISAGAVASYTFSNVTSTHTINASFVLNCATTFGTINQSNCSDSSFTFNGIAQTTAGTYLDTLVNAGGCDSIVTLHMSVTPTTSTTITTTSCYSYTWSVNNVTYYTSGTYVVTSGCQTDILILTINGCLDVKCYVQGYYLGSGTMQSVLNNQGVSVSTSDCDSLNVSLHSTISPYAEVFTFRGMLSTSGTIHCTYPEAVIGNNYYVVLNHRNSIETWSANPVMITGATNYDFTDAGNKAFGNNQFALGVNQYALFSGDINQDHVIDVFDFLILDPDITIGNSGYLTTDLNGDGVVDTFDYILLDPNVTNGVGAITP